MWRDCFSTLGVLLISYQRRQVCTRIHNHNQIAVAFEAFMRYDRLAVINAVIDSWRINSHLLYIMGCYLIKIKLKYSSWLPSIERHSAVVLILKMRHWFSRTIKLESRIFIVFVVKNLPIFWQLCIYYKAFIDIFWDNAIL